jgi:hypothetical protein
VRLSADGSNSAAPRSTLVCGRKLSMLKILGGTIGVIFLIGLIVVIGLLMLIF